MANDLTQGSILDNIRRFSPPYMLSYFLQILYGLADLFVIGLYCDVDSTTAVSNGAQVMHMFTVVIIGLAMGSTVLIGKSVGAGDSRQVSRLISDTVILFGGVAIVMTAALLALNKDIVQLINTPPEAVQGTVDYLAICFAGIPFIVAYNIIASIFRGLGDSKSPMWFVVIACIVNIALDFIFIGHMGLGPKGAALGTVLSQVVSVIAALVAIRAKHLLPKVSLKADIDSMGKILGIGVPVALQDGFIQVSFIIITIIANSRGLVDAAAVGIVEKFIGLLFIVPSTMLATVSAVSSQNLGAGKPDRARKTTRAAIFIAASFGLAASVLLQFIPESAVRIFTNDPDVISQGADYLRSYVWDCALAGVHFCYSGLFMACGWSLISFLHNFISMLVRIPFAYFASINSPDNLYAMGLASPVGSMVSVLICIAFYRWMRRRGII